MSENIYIYDVIWYVGMHIRKHPGRHTYLNVCRVKCIGRMSESNDWRSDIGMQVWGGYD